MPAIPSLSRNTCQPFSNQNDGWFYFKHFSPKPPSKDHDSPIELPKMFLLNIMEDFVSGWPPKATSLPFPLLFLSYFG